MNPNYLNPENIATQYIKEKGSGHCLASYLLTIEAHVLAWEPGSDTNQTVIYIADNFSASTAPSNGRCPMYEIKAAMDSRGVAWFVAEAHPTARISGTVAESTPKPFSSLKVWRGSDPDSDHLP